MRRLMAWLRQLNRRRREAWRIEPASPWPDPPAGSSSADVQDALVDLIEHEVQRLGPGVLDLFTDDALKNRPSLRQAVDLYRARQPEEVPIESMPADRTARFWDPDALVKLEPKEMSGVAKLGAGEGTLEIRDAPPLPQELADDAIPGGPDDPEVELLADLENQADADRCEREIQIAPPDDPPPEGATP